MDAERRLIIIFMGMAIMVSLVTLAVLAFLRRDIPDVVGTVTTGGLALLAPSPLSKSTTPPDPPPAQNPLPPPSGA